MKINKIKDGLKHHIVDSTALLAESTPVFAAFEVGLAGMSDEVSLNARLFAAGLTYFGGMGYFYGKGRDLYRKALHITDKTKERKQTIHDAIYTGLFNLIAAPIIYVGAGSRDIKEIAIGTASAVAFGAINGAPLGYSVDLFRDLTGLKECGRPSYPKLLKKQNSKIKKSLAVLAVAASVALTAGIYALTPDKEIKTNQEPFRELIASEIKKENLEEKTLHLNIK